VLAMVPGCLDVVRVWNRTVGPGLSAYDSCTSNSQVWGQVGTGPLFHFVGSTTFTKIEYLDCHPIAT